MPDLKTLPRVAIPEALEKARHYRLLNEPWQAESICRDILRTDPDNQQVLYTLVLAMTDQFEGISKSNMERAVEETEKLSSEYEKEYCLGLICERQGIAASRSHKPRSGFIAHGMLMRAMDHYDKAEKLQSGTNMEAVLRWNAVVRFIEQHNLKSAPEVEREVQPFLDVQPYQNTSKV